MADKANITPSVLKWARESARVSITSAAAKVAVTPEKLAEWEIGQDQPTVRQGEILAKYYRRPFALFFLPSVPYDFQPLQDFRRKNAQELGTASIFIIREIQQKQAWLRELYEENEEHPLSFVGKYTIKSNPEQVAEDILTTLNIDPNRYVEAPIKEWIAKAEAKGIFISRTSFIHSKLTLDSEELQGFAIADKYAPFVFVNSEDWDAPQLFTLVHELVHIWIAESGISSDIEPKLKFKDKFHPVEQFCNQVAANVLMPVRIMNSLTQADFRSGTDVFEKAKKIGVSSFAFLFRAFKLELISLETYKKLKRDADEAFKEFVRKHEVNGAKRKADKNAGGPNYYMLLVNKNGHLFTRIVMDAFRGGAIQPTRASGLLNTQINHFPKLEAYLHK